MKIGCPTTFAEFRTMIAYALGAHWDALAAAKAPSKVLSRLTRTIEFCRDVDDEGGQRAEYLFRAWENTADERKESPATFWSDVEPYMHDLVMDLGLVFVGLDIANPVARLLARAQETGAEIGEDAVSAKGWSQAQVRVFVRQVRREIGDGWALLVPRLREALIAEQAFSVVRAQDAETVSVAEMDALLLAMRVEAKLVDEGEVSSESSS